MLFFSRTCVYSILHLAFCILHFASLCCSSPVYLLRSHRIWSKKANDAIYHLTKDRITFIKFHYPHIELASFWDQNSEAKRHFSKDEVNRGNLMFTACYNFPFDLGPFITLYIPPSFDSLQEFNHGGVKVSDKGRLLLRLWPPSFLEKTIKWYCTFLA